MTSAMARWESVTMLRSVKVLSVTSLSSSVYAAIVSFQPSILMSGSSALRQAP